MLVIAHRGSNCLAVENSWSAFNHSIKAGAERIELDVQLTKDGHVVVFHDSDLVRLFGRKDKIAELTREGITHLRFDNGEGLPFLDEVIDRLLPQVEINIELKTKNWSLAPKVWNVIKSSPLIDKIVISSFQERMLKDFLNLTDEVKLAYLSGGGMSVVKGVFGPSFSSVMKELALRIVHPNMSQVDQKFMDKANENNWLVYTWASLKGSESLDKNNQLWTDLYTLGVHGHCTNYPEEMVEWRSKGMMNHG